MPESHDATRPTFVFGAAAAAGFSAVRGLGACLSNPRGRADPSHSQTAELGELSAVEAVGRISRGELGAERYAEALLALGAGVERALGPVPVPRI
jgi:hypothetical protein